MDAELNYLNTQSQLLFTLKKQIEAMSPLKISYDNLQRYHLKITADLQTLIDQHDRAILTLSKNNQVLCHFAMKTDEQRTALLNLLRQKQNELAKLILDNKNTTQKHQSLTNKLKLQQNLTDQNKGHQKQLEAIFKNITSQIEILKKANLKACQTNSQMIRQNQFLGKEIESQSLRREKNVQINQTLKEQISKTNKQNQCLAQQNRSLQQNLTLNEKQIQLKIKQSRQLKESQIELRQCYQNIQNQKQYKDSLLKMQEQSMKQLQNTLIRLQNYLNQTKQEKQQVQKQNSILQKQIETETLNFKESQAFLNSSQNHLHELKQINEVLLKKMEDYCIQDKKIQNILMKKAQILQNCYRKMNQTGIFNEKSTNLTIGPTLKKEASFKGSIIDRVTGLSSSKNWNCKQNNSEWQGKKQLA